MTTFSADLTAFVNLTRLRGSQVLRSLALQAHTGVVLRSPVDTGRFRASHRVSINQSDLSVSPELPENTAKDAGIQFGAVPTGVEQAAAVAQLSGVKWTDSVHITNNLPYARPLEDGWSKQTSNAPDGIYGATFQEMRANLQAAVRAARRLGTSGGGSS